MYSVEGDGVCEYLYQYLWSKDNTSSSPRISVPDTVVYKFGQAVHWYFTSVDGHLKKKLKNNIVNTRIEEAMTKRSLGAKAQIVAYYISWDDSSTDFQIENKTGTTIEYFDHEGLHEFLFNRWKQRNGILQRFIEPKGTHNALIRAVWSPKVCLLERRVNNNQLHDQRFGLYERAVTYDGPELYSRALPLRGKVLPTQVQHLCNACVDHVAEVTQQKQRICRAVLNLKVDSHDKVWLLWSNSMRLADERGMPENISTTRSPINIVDLVKIDKTVRLQPEADHSGTDKVSAPARVCCTSCAKHSPWDTFHPVQYKTVITHFEQVLDLASNDPLNKSGTVEWPPSPEILVACGGVGFGDTEAEVVEDKTTGSLRITPESVTIPPVIRALHPKLAADSYSRHRNDPLFLYKTASVCEDCFLVYAELASLAFRAPNRSAISSHTMSTSFTADPRNQSFQRSKVEDSTWRPIAVERSKAKSKKLAMNKTAPSMSTQNIPVVPDAVRRQEDTIAMTMSRSMPSFQSSQLPSPDDEVPMTMEEIIKSREDEFFRDIGADQSMKSSHPLMHLVTSQRKLDSLGVPLHELDPGQAMKRSKKKTSPYNESLLFVQYVGHNRAKGCAKQLINTKSATKDSTSKRRRSQGKGTQAMSSSALRHREFLASTMHEVEQQLAQPTLTEINEQMLEAQRPGTVSTGSRATTVRTGTAMTSASTRNGTAVGSSCDSIGGSSEGHMKEGARENSLLAMPLMEMGELAPGNTEMADTSPRGGGGDAFRATEEAGAAGAGCIERCEGVDGTIGSTEGGSRSTCVSGGSDAAGMEPGGDDKGMGSGRAEKAEKAETLALECGATEGDEKTRADELTPSGTPTAPVASEGVTSVTSEAGENSNEAATAETVKTAAVMAAEGVERAGDANEAAVASVVASEASMPPSVPETAVDAVAMAAGNRDAKDTSELREGAEAEKGTEMPEVEIIGGPVGTPEKELEELGGEGVVGREGTTEGESMMAEQEAGTTEDESMMAKQEASMTENEGVMPDASGPLASQSALEQTTAALTGDALGVSNVKGDEGGRGEEEEQNRKDKGEEGEEKRDAAGEEAEEVKGSDRITPAVPEKSQEGLD
ncbi:unnamed protein product, partial [Chrysoparadoxa australica]